MKKIVFTLMSGICCFYGFSQNRHTPPGNVSESFQKEYPQSKPSEWNHSSAGWSVTFEDRDHNNGEATAYFDTRGRHIETHIPYDNQDVPGPVRDHVQRSYAGADNYEYTRIERTGEKPVYMTHFRHRKKYKTVYVDNSGHERAYRNRY